MIVKESLLCQCVSKSGQPVACEIHVLLRGNEPGDLSRGIRTKSMQGKSLVSVVNSGKLAAQKTLPSNSGQVNRKGPNAIIGPRCFRVEVY